MAKDDELISLKAKYDLLEKKYEELKNINKKLMDQYANDNSNVDKDVGDCDGQDSGFYLGG